MERTQIVAISFDFKKRLGSGYFGEVWHAIDIGLNCERAVKCIPPNKIISQDNFFQEAQILKAAEHPNIVSVYDTGRLDDGRIYVAMEYLPKGSLEDEASGAYISLSRAKRIMSDVLRGLHYAHQQGILHRDIKPANIMIGEKNEGKLSDFGLALTDLRNLDISSLRKYQYILHLAPEVARLNDFTVQADIYAAGVTLYRLVNGDSYLPSLSPDDARTLAIQGLFPDRSRYRGFVSLRMRKLINKAMELIPDNRFRSADDMRHALEQVSTEIDWMESKSATGKVLIGKQSDLQISVERVLQNDGRWSVIVKRGRKLLRRIQSLSRENMTMKQAKQYAYRLLQNTVNSSTK